MSDTGPVVQCQSCRFWAAGEGLERLCHRHAPAAGDRQFQVGRWSETRATDACGEGEALTAGAARTVPQNCDHCVFWNRPGIGIDPGNRGDHFRNWWQKAGYCRRFAPRPGGDIGERAYWRATHASDFCFDGRPA